METLVKVVGGGLFLILILVLCVWNEHEHQDRIRDWADENGYDLIKCEVCVFDHGPWAWDITVDDDDPIYFAKLRHRRTEKEKNSWFLFRWFSGMEQSWGK